MSPTVAKPGKTLDFRPGRDDNPWQVEVLGQPTDHGSVRARAETAARAGSAAQAFALLSAAAEDLEPTDPFEAAMLFAEASWYAQLAHGPEHALEVARRGAGLASNAGGRVRLTVHARLGDALQWNGQYSAARRAWLKAADVSTPPEPRILATRTVIHLRLGDLVTARDGAYAAAARARAAGDREVLRDALTFQAIAEIHLGLLHEADASAADLTGVVGLAASGDRAEALGVQAWIDALLHDVETCQARIAAAVATAHELHFTPSSGMAAGLLALRERRYEEAASFFERKLFGASAVAAMLSLRPFLESLVEACWMSRDRERAEALVDEVYAPALATNQPRYVALASRIRALTSGDLSYFEVALDKHARWGNRFEEARTLLLYGETLRRAKQRKEARAQLSAATSRFAAVGASAWHRRAQDELRAAGAKLPRSASGTTLTAQEQRVAALIADGLSNKEIASSLFISVKTVEGHLRNIFEKLGLRSRTQLARHGK